MLTMSAAEVETRARQLVDRLGDISGLRAAIVDGVSTAGGGSAPGSALPTKLVAIQVEGLSAEALDTRLRAGDPPIVARIQDDRVVLDLRTVAETDESDLVDAIRRACSAQA